MKRKLVKKRIDQLLVERGFFPSRSRAQAAILEGLIYVSGKKVEKAGTFFSEDVEIEIKGEPYPYVSRGGVKLESALKKLKIEVSDKRVLDIGASTGGFTDCLLQHGVARVYAIDVGYGQLAWKLRQNPKVAVLERTNIRYLTLEKFLERFPEAKKQRPNFATIDVSFISLTKVLPAVYNLLGEKAEVLALIKPQFEARKEQVGKGGIVKDKKVHKEVIEKIIKSAREIGFTAKEVMPSPITGADGNVEYFIYLVK
ncbi:MAG: TlyA family RNA methyltransferase [Candidatus Margulisiibacteriota bacterium]